MKTKRFILMLLVMQLMALNVFADASGSFGEDSCIEWTFTESTGNLLIETPSLSSPIPLPDFDRVADQPWYYYAPDIETITLRGNITAIGKNNFTHFDQLETVILSNGSHNTPNIISIGEYAFMGCNNLSNVGTLFDNVTTIESRAFRNCYALQNVTLPEATTIDDDAFDNCSSLQSVSLPKVTTIDWYAFCDCSSLTSITMPLVTQLGRSAFEGCTSLTAFTLPTAVTTISDGTFKGCTNLSNLTLHDGITSIGSSAFEGCTAFTSFTVPTSVRTIGNAAFKGCTNLSTLTLNNSITSIGNNAFEGCTAFTSFTVPTSVRTIGNAAFYNCTNLSTLTLNNGITSIGNNAFEGCTAFTSFSIPASVTTISDATFKGCTNLSTLTLHDDITAIGNSAFEGCTAFISFTVPTKVTAIKDGTFKGCTGLTSMTFSDKITSIGANAFNGCTGLTEMTVERTTPPTVGSNAFAGVDKSIPLHIPDRTLYVYQNADGWKDFTNMQTPPLHYVLNDAVAYTETDNLLCNTLTYNRTFNTANTWQPLFVPFDIVMTADLLAKCDIAIPYMVATEGAALPGMTEASGYNVVVVMKLNQGDIAQHGTTYFIRPKTAGDFQIVLNDIVIYNRTSTTTLTCATTSDEYTFVGQYTSGKPSSGITWYALADGNLQLGDMQSPNLPAQRWYMTQTSKSGVPAYAPARAMRLATWGEDDTTGLGSILTDEMEGNNAIYSISGVRLAQPQKGLNIVNGRKVFIK